MKNLYLVSFIFTLLVSSGMSSCYRECKDRCGFYRRVHSAESSGGSWFPYLLGGGAAVAAFPFVLTAAGFTGAGIAAGSIAAGVQHYIGNVAVGSTFAALQSTGATIGAASVASVSTGAAVGGAVKVVKDAVTSDCSCHCD